MEGEALNTFVIAEAGVNHNGDLGEAINLVNLALKAGANAVKFQTFRTESVVSLNTPLAPYQIKLESDDENQYDLIKKLELPFEDFVKIKNYCDDIGIEFISTPFDYESLDFLVELGVSQIKLPSGELTNLPFLIRAANSGLPIILSTGMSYLSEVEMALKALSAGYNKASDTDVVAALNEPISSATLDNISSQVSILHCVSAYPAPLEDLNLSAITTLQNQFNLKTGFSDHSLSNLGAVTAVALGASIIEKHITTDRKQIGPDHAASYDSELFVRYVKDIRDTEKLLGNGKKIPMESEIEVRNVARRSLVAARDIKKGETFTVDMILIKRPGTGIPPSGVWNLIGTVAKNDFLKDTLLF